MPGVLFLQTDWLDHLGTLYLSAFLKTHGIDTSIVITRSAKKLLQEAERSNPELIAVSITSAGHQQILELLARARPGLRAPVVAGGAHPTFFPEVLLQPQLDFIIRGEGEESLWMLLMALREKSALGSIPALGYKSAAGVKLNNAARLNQELDSLPFPDRKLYFKYGYYRRMRMQRVITCRGCPYNCGYCFNAALREFYRGAGRYVRQRSAANVIEELKQILPFTSTVNFVDDSFGLDRKFAEELLERYAVEIGLPFIVNLRPEQVDADFASRLARAGCYCAQLGIESGSDQLREQLLGRKVSREQIFSAVRYLREQKVKILSYNMLGLPGETLEQGMETIRLNRELEIDFPRFSIFQPYPGTALGEEVVRKGWVERSELMKSLSGSYFHKSPLQMPGIRELSNLQKLFLPAIRCPKRESVLRKLLKLPANPVFELVFLVTIAGQYRQATNRSLRETLAYGLRNFSLYLA
jgi:radical SAM superfamily enzyme YgiQ (UPF0313 family)